MFSKGKHMKLAVLACMGMLLRFALVHADGVASGCCLDVTCCPHDEFCCDDCSSSCMCSVGGRCPEDVDRSSNSGGDSSKEYYQQLFQQYKKDFGRDYGSPIEEQRRFIIFVQNMKRLESLRKLDPEGHAEGHFPANHYSDRTLKEFAAAHKFTL